MIWKIFQPLKLFKTHIIYVQKYKYTCIYVIRIWTLEIFFMLRSCSCQFYERVNIILFSCFYCTCICIRKARRQKRKAYIFHFYSLLPMGIPYMSFSVEWSRRKNVSSSREIKMSSAAQMSSGANGVFCNLHKSWPYFMFWEHDFGMTYLYNMSCLPINVWCFGKYLYRLSFFFFTFFVIFWS